jgi:hypothetical protein
VTELSSTQAPALEGFDGFRGAIGSPRATSAVPVERGLDQGAWSRAARSGALHRWRAALARGDGAEVERLVQQSHADRVAIAASGQLGAMLGQRDPSASSGAID